LPLPWFRRQKKAEQQAPLEAAVPTVEPEPTTTTASPAIEPAADGQQTAARKRRRGSRGGRGRKKRPASGAVATAEADAAEKPEKAEKPDRPARPARESQQSERKSRPARAPRRSAPRRAPLPKAARRLLVSVDPGEKRVAVIEDGLVAEVYLERPEHRSIAGNIYLGTVDNVLPGMEAAFVEIGLEKNGFLYVDEIVGPELEGRRGARKIQDLIQRGQTILVQAVKDPMKTKGARLTTEISLPGRFVVYVPHGDGLGVSRRLDDDERNRLKSILKEISPKTGGVIVRTAAEGASAEDIGRDLDFLMRLWSTIEASANKASAPALIYQEAELPLRVTRDLFTGDFEKLVVDHDRTYKRIVGYLKKTSPHMVERVERYKERTPLLEETGVEKEIQSTLNRRVDLPSGGYLIFDYAEAFTVIDVNTGRFVGSRSKRNGAGRLEDTITKNNLEAVREVVRQLRLRDIGGIIVIDFIDMANPKNRQQVEDALRQELERDRTKTYVVEISPLGLVEMTRQNVTDGPREVMTRKCPTCDGDGIIVSESTAAVEVERRIRALVTPGSRAKAFKVEVSAKIVGALVGPDGSRLRELEELTKRRFFLVGLEDVHLDHMRLLEQGTVEKLAPESPVEVGEEIELKLGEVGLHDARAGVGKLKGIEVVVAEAAKLVGKKVKVRVVAVMEGVAYAVQVVEGGESQPITAEAEAERPTRAKRPVKVAESAEEAEEETVEAEAVEEEVAPPKRSSRRAPAKKPVEAAAEGEAEQAEKPAPTRSRSRKPAAAAAIEVEDASVEAVVEAEEADAPAEEEAAEGDAPATPRKRTRRGTRGGRGRKRKPTAAGAETNGDGDLLEEPAEIVEELPEAEEPAAPVIHLPDRDLGTNGDEPVEGESEGETPATPRKRTRRGTRGGRGRKPKTAAVAAGEEGGAVEEAAPEGEGDWQYTPMSEWGDV
jgi:ribonuclease G